MNRSDALHAEISDERIHHDLNLLPGERITRRFVAMILHESFLPPAEYIELADERGHRHAGFHIFIRRQQHLHIADERPHRDLRQPVRDARSCQIDHRIADEMTDIHRLQFPVSRADMDISYEAEVILRLACLFCLLRALIVFRLVPMRRGIVSIGFLDEFRMMRVCSALRCPIVSIMERPILLVHPPLLWSSRFIKRMRRVAMLSLPAWPEDDDHTDQDEDERDDILEEVAGRHMDIIDIPAQEIHPERRQDDRIQIAEADSMTPSVLEDQPS